MRTMTPIRREVWLYTLGNLTALCRELIEWQDTGYLCDGFVRELAKRCIPLASADDELQVAESYINRAAVRRFVNLGG